MITQIGYAIGVLISILCAALLIRSYRRERTPLLLWCSLCFVGLALNNVLLFADLFVVSEGSLELWRSTSALLSLSLMLFGLIWEEL
jgi:cytochrome bd-type quinol oxidase subunit 2